MFDDEATPIKRLEWSKDKKNAKHGFVISELTNGDISCGFILLRYSKIVYVGETLEECKEEAAHIIHLES